MQTFKNLIPWTCICFIFAFAFLNKPPSNDDLVFLEYADLLSWNIFKTEPTDYLFHNMLLENFVVFESSHPPLIPYWIKILGALGGEKMWVYHLGFFPFWVMACFSVGELLKRFFDVSPFLAVFLVLNPLCLVQATSLMTDFPLLALFFTAWWSWEHFMDRPRPLFFFLTALFSMACFFTAFQGLAILPLVLIRSWVRKPLAPSIALSICAFLPFLLWLFWVYKSYGIFPFLSEPRAELSIQGEVAKGLLDLPGKFMALVFYLGASLGLPSLVWIFRLDLKRALVFILAGLGWALFVATTGIKETWIWPTILAFLGVLVISVGTSGALDCFKKSPGTLISWLFPVLAFLSFAILIAPFASPRYVLLMLTCWGAFIIFKLKESVGRLWVLGLLNLILAFSVAVAERQYARAQDLANLELPQNQIHVLGEMGVKHSAERLGLPLFVSENEDQVGYLLVPHPFDISVYPKELIERSDRIQSFQIGSSWPIRVDSPLEETSIYLHPRGLLPFIFSKSNLVQYDLYRCVQTALPFWRDQPQNFTTPGPILPDGPLSYDFENPHNGFFRLDLYFATHNRQNTCQVLVLLEKLDGNLQAETEVARFHFLADSVEDNRYRTFDFAPQPKGKYRLTIKSPNSDPSNAITLWINAGLDDQFKVGESVRKGSPGVIGYYSPTP